MMLFPDLDLGRQLETPSDFIFLFGFPVQLNKKRMNYVNSNHVP